MQVNSKNITVKDFYQLVNDSRLTHLEKLITRFNPFKIIGVERREIKHSNVLSWMFEPKGHHGFGDRFVKDFLLESIAYNIDAHNDYITGEDVLGVDFSDIVVKREYKNIDILLVSHSQKLVVAIENKIDASESEHQLSKYEDIVQAEFEGYKHAFVFLTLKGDSPENSKNWVVFSHEKIVPIVKKNLDMVQDRINQQVSDFVNHYIDLLEEIAVNTTETRKLAFSIYKEHKEVLDTIIEAITATFDFAKLEAVLHRQTDTQRVESKTDKTVYAFCPKTWLNKTVKVSGSAVENVRFVLDFRQFNDAKITLFLQHVILKDNFTNSLDFHNKLRAGDAEKKLDFVKDIKQAKNHQWVVLYKNEININHLDLFNHGSIIDEIIKVCQSQDVQYVAQLVEATLNQHNF